jgi:hypothetical protein
MTCCAGKPQQGKKQKKAFVRKEESEDEEPDGDGDDSEDSEEPDAGSMGSSSDEDGDAGADVAAANTGSQPTPQRRSGRRRSSVSSHPGRVSLELSCNHDCNFPHQHSNG